MNYEVIYDSLIQKRQTNKISKRDCYCEQHHIVPVSLGGSDEDQNLVNLTAAEHYIAHLLLERITRDKHGANSKQHMSVLNAIFFMSNIERYGKKITSKTYQYLRESYAQMMSEKMTGEGNPMFGRNDQSYAIVQYSHDRKGKSDAELYGEERAKEIAYLKGATRGKPKSEAHKKKMSASLKGISSKSFMTPETILQWKANMSKARKGIPKSEEHKRKIGLGNKGKVRTQEMKDNLRKKNTGKKRTAETKLKISLAHKGKKVSEETRKRMSKNNAMNNHTIMDFMTEDEIQQWRENISKSSRGRKKMIHPITGKRINPKKEDCQKFLDQGYIFGNKIN